MSLPQMLLIVCPLIFLASFVDSVAGGGGLISLPAYMLTGLPMHTVCGSNKLSASIGTAISAVRFYKNGCLHLKGALFSAGAALIGAYCGVRLNIYLPNDLLKKAFVFLLPFVALFVLFGKGKVRKQLLEGRKLYLFCTCIGFGIGMYDGLIGPGTGTFLIFCYTSFVGFDYVTASGNAKIANLASNLASLAVYLAGGHVALTLALPAACCSILGGWLGSGMAIHKGSKFIRKMLIVVLIGIFAKLIYDLMV